MQFKHVHKRSYKQNCTIIQKVGCHVMHDCCTSMPPTRLLVIVGISLIQSSPVLVQPGVHGLIVCHQGGCLHENGFGRLCSQLAPQESGTGPRSAPAQSI